MIVGDTTGSLSIWNAVKGEVERSLHFVEAVGEAGSESFSRDKLLAAFDWVIVEQVAAQVEWMVKFIKGQP